MIVLGVWDGHDAGAAIVEDGLVKVAVNEERLTRRKLDVGFPANSINACLKHANLKPEDVSIVAMCGSQFSQALVRAFPSIGRNYYNFRRRLTPKPRFEKFKRLFLKYRMSYWGSSALTRKYSKFKIRKLLESMGFKNFKLYLVGHHEAHIASAAFTSGMNHSLCITLDGVGDGVSGTVNVFKDGKFERLSTISGKNSLSTIYEQVTTLLGMRELEDEGKTMCIADYSYPIPEEKNKMIDFYSVNGLNINSKYSNPKRYTVLQNLLWNTTRESFACMVQKTLEKHMVQLFKNAMEQTGLKDVCWTGGIAANIKANRIIKLTTGLNDWYVFPHMGDGGLAVGAALHVNNQLSGIKSAKLPDAYLGLEFSENEIETELKQHPELSFELRQDAPQFAGDLLKDAYVFWYQGRMEFGPRALGNRSILAPAGSLDIKNNLNMNVKKRGWFQPFCPSLLDEDAKTVFEDYDHADKFMTMGHMAKPEFRPQLASVTHIDGSARPQMVTDENKRYRELIEQVKKNTGLGVVLNTSFNLHGFPIVCSPKDAIEVMLNTKTRYMFLGNFYVELKR